MAISSRFEYWVALVMQPSLMYWNDSAMIPRFDRRKDVTVFIFLVYSQLLTDFYLHIYGKTLFGKIETCSDLGIENYAFH